jgi:hypothetical protein
LRLRRRHLVTGERALDEQPLARSAAIVEHVAPGKRVRLARAQPLVGENADERCVLLVEPGADRLDRLRVPGVDRRRADVCEPACADDRVPGEPAPLHGTVEDALQYSERAVDSRGAGAVCADARAVRVDRPARDLAEALATEVIPGAADAASPHGRRAHGPLHLDPDASPTRRRWRLRGLPQRSGARLLALLELL